MSVPGFRLSQNGETAREGGRKLGPLFLAVLLCACASTEKKQRQTVAIFPAANSSVNVAAPDLVRATLNQTFTDRGYTVVSSNTVDANLKELGFTSGDQLGALNLGLYTPKLAADWYIYTSIEEFAFKSAVAFSQREVALKLKIVDPSGAVVYEGTEKGITTRGGVDAAGDLVLNLTGKVFKGVKDVGKKVVVKSAEVTGDIVPAAKGATTKMAEVTNKAADLTDNVADVDLAAETREAVRKILDQLDKK